MRHYLFLRATDSHFDSTVAFYDRDNNEVWILDKGLLPFFDTTCITSKNSIMIAGGKAKFFDKYNTTKENINYHTIHRINQLKEISVKVLPYSPLGTDYAIVKYLQENYYNTGRVEYGVVGYNNKRETIIDKTNRSWIEIWLQGYKGNRLDVMVGNYSSFIIFPQKENICLGLKRQGEKYRPTNDFYRDTVFDVACDVKSFIMRKG